VAPGSDELAEARRRIGDGVRCGNAEDVEAFGLGVGDEARLQPRQVALRQKSRLV
jgi:hypothetical protein